MRRLLVLFSLFGFLLAIGIAPRELDRAPLKGSSTTVEGSGMLSSEFGHAESSARGNVWGFYAASRITVNDGTRFGNRVDKPDTWADPSSGLETVSLFVPGLSTYLGKPWGDDAYGSLQFFNGTFLVGVIAGGNAETNAPRNPSHGTNYFDLDLGAPVSIVDLTGPPPPFEADDIPGGAPLPRSQPYPVPEPGAWSLFVFGLVALAAIRGVRSVTTTGHAVGLGARRGSRTTIGAYRLRSTLTQRTSASNSHGATGG